MKLECLDILPNPLIGEKLTIDSAMKFAITLAKKGAGWVSPNPQVGCVFLNQENHLLSYGYHEQLGGPHAEAMALEKILDRSLLVGAKVIVTLEPCAHVGRTPSCAETLSQLPIGSVYFGSEDPNPLVKGRGLKILQVSGIRTTLYDRYKEEIADLMEVYLFNQSRQRSFVSVKVATTLDGYLGMASGESQWITNASARSWAHELRGRYDAILVGRRTLELDNPSLNIRSGSFSGKEMKVIVVDPQAKTLQSLKTTNIYKCRLPHQIYYIVQKGAHLGVKECSIPEENIIAVAPLASGSLDLKSALSITYKQGIGAIFVEGGSDTYTLLMKEKLVQKLYLFMAASLLGGISGKSWTQNLEITSLQDQIRLGKTKLRFFEDNLLITGQISQ